LSASTSCNLRAADLLHRVRLGEKPSPEFIKRLGEDCPGEFFRGLIEPLADSFTAPDANIYLELMRAWIPAAEGPGVQPEIPARVDTVYVLSRVTLGADIKIVSPILRAMRSRFPQARIVFITNRKSADLFENDGTIEFLEAAYPRTGSICDRVAFAEQLRDTLATPHRIVIDPDSRITQLGLIPVCEPERYFHFPSRTAGGESDASLSDLVSDWLNQSFDAAGNAWIAPATVAIDCALPIAAVSLGVGENENKRLGLGFEAALIAAIAARFPTVYLDRGMGGAERQRVTEAAERSGAIARIRFSEGSFAAFASIIARSQFYAGYDSAGQHAAASAGTPLVTVFAGAPSDRFRARWSPDSPTGRVINADAATPDECLDRVRSYLDSL
jgi:ADP-heptose:LPS heptosyltransferase